jgi:nitroimidazol reductase NimA-like FMN-containing flavoprotein (pyridoxamine 5'-phosphate oxidase superfamily)
MMSKGPWSRHQIEVFLEHALVPVRLACNGSSGHPVLVSLWFLPIDGKLWCATQRSAHVASMLTRDPHCAFEVSVEKPPYRGVRGPAVASLHDDRGEEILRKLLDRYLQGSNSKLESLLLSRAENETAIAIEPKKLVSWDYSERMRDAV